MKEGVEMIVKQISAYVENTTGRLLPAVKALGDAGVNILAMTIADAEDYGILRCIVDDPDKAGAVLKENGFSAAVTEVIAVELEDRPGGLVRTLEVLSSSGISVDYLYSVVRSREGHALLVVKVSDAERAAQRLTQEGIRLVCRDDF